MKRLLIAFLILSLIAVGFIVFVFKGDHPSLSLSKKNYIKQLKIVEQQFASQLKQTEIDIYNSFLQNQLNIKIIESILKKNLPKNSTVSFVKFRDDLMNFSIFSQDRKLLYQINSERNYLKYINSFSKEKKIFNTIDGLTIFQIPYENNLQSGILLFEFNTYNFLDQALKVISQNLNSKLIIFPKLLVVDEQSNNVELTKRLINNSLGNCLSSKQFCDIYISPLQKRLIIDANKYVNISVGVLYSSNPMDIPRTSALIIFILLIMAALILLLVFLLSIRKKPSEQILQLANKSSESPPPILPDNKNLNAEEIEIDTYINPEDLPDLRDDDEVLEIEADKFQSKNTIPADKELSNLQQEINSRNNINKFNEKGLKESYKKLSFGLIKDFFPTLNHDNVENTLREFTYADSLILLELKEDNYQSIESFNVDRYTSENCMISKDHLFIKDYLNKRKGLLINNFANTNILPKEIFSDREHLKIKSLFMFSFNIDKSKYVFLIY